MNSDKIYKKILKTISIWEASLSNYSDEELAKKTSPDSWSMGQLYAHLFSGTLNFQLKEITKCLSGNDNANESKTIAARITFLTGAFPPIKIKVPPSETYTPKQPANKAAIENLINDLKTALAKFPDQLSKSVNKGKTKHPAFGYMNALEWFCLIEMHFRHHLSQKARIEKFFNS